MLVSWASFCHVSVNLPENVTVSVTVRNKYCELIFSAKDFLLYVVVTYVDPVYRSCTDHRLHRLVTFDSVLCDILFCARRHTTICDIVCRFSEAERSAIITSPSRLFLPLRLCLSACLSVYRISEEVVNEFWWKFLEGGIYDPTATDLILVEIGSRCGYGNFLKKFLPLRDRDNSTNFADISKLSTNLTDFLEGGTSHKQQTIRLYCWFVSQVLT